jgi:hypothetical protein
MVITPQLKELKKKLPADVLARQDAFEEVSRQQRGRHTTHRGATVRAIGETRARSD